MRGGEAALQRAILDYLAVRRILAFRLNTGAVTAQYKGKTRFVKFGVPGMADIIAFPGRRVMWIECKSLDGRQTELQRSFQSQVEEAGHTYIVARYIEDVEKELA